MINLNGSNVGEMYYGSTKISEAYLGSYLVYGAAKKFNRFMFRWNFTDGTGSNAFQLDEININRNKGTTLSSYSYVTANPSTGYTNQGPEKMLDNSLSTKWCCGANALTTACLIFDSPSAITPSSYNLFAGGDTQTFPVRRPHEVYLFGTDDNTVTAHNSNKWHLLSYSGNANLTTVNNGKDTLVCQGVSKKKKYQYFQWSYVPAAKRANYGASQVQMGQIILIDKISGTIMGPNNLKLIAQKNGTNWNSTQGPSALFDGKDPGQTTWGMNTTAGVTGGITFSSTMPLDISGIGLQEGGDTTVEWQRVPVCWALWGSETPNTAWNLNNGWDLLYLGDSNLPATSKAWSYFETYNIRG